jgi:hypothetical protein
MTLIPSHLDRLRDALDEAVDYAPLTSASERSRRARWISVLANIDSDPTSSLALDALVRTVSEAILVMPTRNISEHARRGRWQGILDEATSYPASASRGDGDSEVTQRRRIR